MHGDEHHGQERRLASDDASRQRERGKDHERAEEGGDQASRHLPVADERLGERDQDRIERMEQGIEGRARRLELLGHRHVDDPVGLNDRKELGDEHPDGQRERGDREGQDHAPPRASVS